MTSFLACLYIKRILVHIKIKWEDFFDLIQFSGCLYSELAWEQLIQILYKIMFNFKNLID